MIVLKMLRGSTAPASLTHFGPLVTDLTRANALLHGPL